MGFEIINHLEYIYFDQSQEDKAYLLVHGVRGGIDEAFIQTLLRKITARGDTVLACNFPYLTRGETVPSGGAFDEELNTLQSAYDFLKGEGKMLIHIIAKSFGAIAVSHWLARNPSIKDVSVNVMGYVTGEGMMIPDALHGRFSSVVQGEHDKYTTPDAVRAELRAHQVVGAVIEIPDADHSYRDMVNPNPAPYAYQEKAIDALLTLI
jgi:predicted alpha/beta-hydrolase family hydrolase